MLQEIIRNVTREMEAGYAEPLFQGIIQDFARRLEMQCGELAAEFENTLDFGAVEQAVADTCAHLSATILQTMLNNIFVNAIFIANLKAYAATRGMRFKEYREITVCLGSGQRVRIMSPYFIKTSPKRKGSKRYRKQQKKSDIHIGLSICGFIGHHSPELLSEAVQTALLCPSFEVACTVLERRGIRLDVKAVRRLCKLAGSIESPLRGKISLSGDEDLKGRTLVISIDGGRLRERRRKRGRKAKNAKRQGYHANRKEPKLFTIYLTDAKGNIIKKFKPLHDATMGDHTEMFELLEQYLSALNLGDVERIVFCGDGGEWIWNDVEKLLKKKVFDKDKVYQVLDYTHAKQNLWEIINLAPLDKKASTAGKWEYFLWNGEIDALKKSIEETVKGKTKLEQALKKWKEYFSNNSKRMQYAKFKKEGLPCGSGHVESAVRRVINLRLKAPGTFWTKDMAECFLFLRSQLISGRWDIFMGNLTALVRRTFRAFYEPAGTSGIMPEAA